jgi:peptidoglycan/LPS O-acetylase OafA/YrhL
VPKPAKGPHLSYRPGLDGLRALAVTAVLLYHAWPYADGGSWLPGGFLGVDLFFVLSGFLITSILLIEWEHHRRIDLLRFWKRRARRLFPAVVVVVFGSLLLAAIFSRARLTQTRHDAIPSLFYFANWHQIVANHSYYNLTGLPSLLQHFWSLAVEEQFYIVWPLLFVPGLIFLGRRWMTVAIAIGIVASSAEMWLLYNGPYSNPSRVYFGTDSRAFLLLMGIELAFIWPHVERIRRALPLLELLGWVALGLTIWLFFTVDDWVDPVFYRGGDLAAAFCFAVLIAAVAHPRTIIGKAFGFTPLRWIGERSYGIYLWHWPIVALTRPGVDVSWTGATGIVLRAALTVTAAALSFRFVEQPIRMGRVQKRLARLDPGRRTAIVAGGIGALALAFAILFIAPSSTTARAAGGPKPHHHPPKNHHPHPKPPPRHKHKLPPGHMLALGDSVMLGCKSALRLSLDYRVRVDAAIGRQIRDTTTDVNHYRKKHRLPKVVIIQVGNNGPLLYNDLVGLKAALHGVPDVVVVNVRNDTSWQNKSNTAITGWLRDWRAAHLADWYHHSTDKMLSDGTHPWPYACHTYARLIATTLREANS